ncbi:hypothetical protein BDN72DRAFT_863362 [Pluteus cervinus]|uniref:Uncharacterized protein n=1 Tax=Pluteus cervinus TaxID=181527 RepID=A0ACD3A7Y0_9AGAR|nr:hypothetical protein BDN72DRAFT_863362 [Pluteus cervinus]
MAFQMRVIRGLYFSPGDLRPTVLDVPQILQSTGTYDTHFRDVLDDDNPTIPIHIATVLVLGTTDTFTVAYRYNQAYQVNLSIATLDPVLFWYGDIIVVKRGQNRDIGIRPGREAQICIELIKRFVSYALTAGIGNGVQLESLIYLQLE